MTSLGYVRDGVTTKLPRSYIVKKKRSGSISTFIMSTGTDKDSYVVFWFCRLHLLIINPYVCYEGLEGLVPPKKVILDLLVFFNGLHIQGP